LLSSNRVIHFDALAAGSPLERAMPAALGTIAHHLGREGPTAA
jgi:hypothetical protein